MLKIHLVRIMEGTTRVFSSDEEANAFIKTVENETMTKFIAQRSRKSGVNDIESLDKHKIWWDDCSHPNNRGPYISFMGSPYVVLGAEVRECHHGPDRNGNRRRREFAVKTKKMDCPAKIRIRRVLRFPAMKIKGDDTKSKRRLISRQLKEKFCDSIERQYQVYIRFPPADEHQSHLVGKVIEDKEDTCSQSTETSEVPSTG